MQWIPAMGLPAKRCLITDYVRREHCVNCPYFVQLMLEVAPVQVFMEVGGYTGVGCDI